MPDGAAPVFDVTSVMASVLVYAKSWLMAFGSHGRICTLVPAAGAPEPASMHRSRVVPLLYAWISPPAMFWLVVLNVYVARSVRPDAVLTDPPGESVPRERSSA